MKFQNLINECIFKKNRRNEEWNFFGKIADRDLCELEGPYECPYCAEAVTVKEE